MLDKEEKYKRLIFLPIVLIITSLYIIGFNVIDKSQQRETDKIAAIEEGTVLSAADKETGLDDENNQASVPAQCIDINSATVEEIMTLPGIGEKRARAIVDLRNEMKGFRSVDEIIYVPGIGKKIVESIKEYIIVLPYEDGN